jgi:hypothetical protein
MAVVSGQFLYDVSDPAHPRLVCRTTTTYLHVLDGNAVAYTTVAAKKVYIVRRDLTTGAEFSIGRLPADPHGAKTWTSDGSLEVYVTSQARGNGSFLNQVHLWSNGSDHVLFGIDPGFGGMEGRWGALPAVEFSPDHAYVALSESTFSINPHNVRIFSVADRRQALLSGTVAVGGTWVSSNTFVWATSSGLVMQWTPSAGPKLFRSERWHGPTSSSNGEWLAATLLNSRSEPHVLVVAVSGSQTFQSKGLGSAPTFITPTVVWYAEERPDVVGPTSPNGIVHSLDLTDGTDRVVQFRTGEKPTGTLCCATRV